MQNFELFRKLPIIYDVFDNNEIALCGSLVDFYWIDEKNVSDINILITEKEFFKYFKIKQLEKHVFSPCLELSFRNSSKFGIYYQGNFHGCNIDLYPKENFHSEGLEIINGTKFKINKKIKIKSINKRISDLKNHLNFAVSQYLEHWELTWILEKQLKAEQKLKKYFEIGKNLL